MSFDVEAERRRGEPREGCRERRSAAIQGQISTSLKK
jgi:hypothetical protein